MATKMAICKTTKKMVAMGAAVMALLGAFGGEPLERDITFVVPEGESAVAVSPDFVGERPPEATRLSDGSLSVTLPKGLLNAYTLVRIACKAR